MTLVTFTSINFLSIIAKCNDSDFSDKLKISFACHIGYQPDHNCMNYMVIRKMMRLWAKNDKDDNAINYMYLYP